MFGLKNNRTVTVEEFDCSPRIEGPVYVAFGLFIPSMFLGLMALTDEWKIIPLMIIAAVSLGLIAYGVYLWRYRSKPLRRSVVLGTRFHGLYLRSKWLFLLTEAAIGAAITAGVTLLFSLPDIIRGEAFDALSWFDRHGVMIFGYVVYFIAQEYLSYYAYYKSEQYAAAKAAADTATHNPQNNNM